MTEKILIINPGSTSTKVALYSDNKSLAEETIQHTTEEISQFQSIPDQKGFRKENILSFLSNQAVDISELTAVVGRGGLLHPIVGGTYLIDQSMLEDLESEKYGSHASNLGAILANEIAKENNLPSYIVDPVVVDEFDSLARVSGLDGIVRRSVGHALNQKAVAREVLSENGKKYEESNVIVAHLGGGISIGAHSQGQMIEMVNGLDGEGPYSPERTGELPVIDFSKKVIEEDLTIDQVKKLIAGNGGIKSYLNETDIRIIEEQITAGDKKSKLYLDAMCYQIARYIGSVAPALEGNIDYIILTGGISYSKYVVSKIKQYVAWITEVKVVPGEKEMKALYEGVKRVIDEIELEKKYDEWKIQEVNNE